MKIFTYIAGLCILIIAGCKKNHDASMIKIEGYQKFDGVGNDWGHIGNEDDDWTFVTNLSAAELALFDFTTPYTLDNTKETTVSFPISYPNPVDYMATLHAVAADSVLFKAVIVDDHLRPFLSMSQKTKGVVGISYVVSAVTNLKNSSSYRIYYSFSAEGKPNFKTGYGDIRTCSSLGTCSF